MVALPLDNAPGAPSVWELAADDVLSVVLRDENAYRYARFEAGLLPALLPPKHAATLQAVYSLRDASEPIHDTLIMARTQGKVDLYWLNTVMALYDPVRAKQDVFRKNLSLVKDEGRRAGTLRLMDIAAQQLTRGDDRTRVTRNLITVLEGLDASGAAIQGVTAGEHGATYATRLMTEPTPPRTTGILWLDELTGGYMPANLWWIAGAYKSRKTTVLLNLALGAAVMGESPAILSREMTQEQVYWQLVTMLAVALLKKRGHGNDAYKTKDGKSIPLVSLSPISLMQASNAYKRWPAEKVRAIDDAIGTYRALNMRIYDSKPQHGNLSSIDTLEQAVLYDLERFRGTLYFADYIQLFTAPGDSVAQQEEIKANTVQNICKRRDTTIICVAQQNEAGVKGEQSYSPNIAGGGAVPKTANILLATQYKRNDSDPDDKLKLIVKLARNAASRLHEDLTIHPQTGLIEGQTWFSKLS